MVALHGAIGVTWEHQAHRYLKRAHGGRYLFGTPARRFTAIAAGLIDGDGIPELPAMWLDVRRLFWGCGP